MRNNWHFGRLLAVVALLPVAAEVHGQYAPYSAQQFQQQPYAPPQQAAASRPQAPQQQAPPQQTWAGQAAYTPYQSQQAFTQPGQPQGYGYAPVQGQPYAQQPYATQPQYSLQPRVAMAMQEGGSEELPLTPSAESVPPGSMQPNPAPAPMMQPTPASSSHYGGYVPSPAGGADCNCQTAAPGGVPVMQQSYPVEGCATGSCSTGMYDGGYAGYGCATGLPGDTSCGGYSTFGCGIAREHGRLGGLGAARGCNYWFGGVYGLLMERDHGDKVPLLSAVDGGMPVGSYSPSSDIVLTTRNVDTGYQGGVEFRLGRTLGGRADACGCCSSPCWGLEGVYWTLFDETANASYVQSGTTRLYSMIDPRGLEYNPGSGYRPLRDYFDYAPPAEDHTTGGDIWVRNVRVRSTFEVQNVELNLLRLPVFGGGGVVAGPAACGGCDTGCGGCDTCGVGAACGGCGCGSRFSCTTLCGFRYMRFDESFMYGVDYDNVDAAFPSPIDGFMNYNAEVTNDLYGFQFGCNGLYRIGCKWGIQLASNFGLYGNDIDVHQYFQFPVGGALRYIQSAEAFNARASKTDVAMIGELRLGVSYQYSCRCRLYGGWRAIGVTGIALATDQAPGAFIDAPQMNNYVNSNGSMILHGLQTGVEWNY